MADEELIDDVIESGSPESVMTEEKMIPQSRVNKIVAREKAQAEERARRQFEEQARREAEMRSEAIASANSRDIGGMNGVNIDKIKRDVYEQIMSEAREEQARQQDESHRAQMQEVVQTYHQKMSKGKESYDDFDAVMKDFNAAAFPKIVLLASQLENTPEVMYELAKNPMKLASIDYLADKNPQEAQRALRSLALSIQGNQAALNQRTASEPLSRLKSSASAGVGSGGSMSIADFKKAPWNRV